MPAPPAPSCQYSPFYNCFHGSAGSHHYYFCRFSHSTIGGLLEKARAVVEASGCHPGGAPAGAFLGSADEKGDDGTNMDVEAEGIELSAQNLPTHPGAFERSYRISSEDRFKPAPDSSATPGIEDQLFILVFMYYVVLCFYKTPKRSVRIEVPHRP